MKITGISMVYNELENKNLRRLLDCFKVFCDDIVILDHESTDGGMEVIKEYTNHIISLPNFFDEELIHKQKLLDYVLEKINPDWIVLLDGDEVVDKPEEVRPLLEKLDKEGYDSVQMHLINLWLSEDKMRLDSQFNRLWKTNVWKNNGKLEFPEIKTLHMPQQPTGIENTYISNISILHYGFSRRELVEKKIDIYKKYGQAGENLDRLNPDRKAKLKPIKFDYEKPKISIGIPVLIDSKQDLEFLKETINSVLEQNYDGNVEVLVVDDSSPKNYSKQAENICEVLFCTTRYIRSEVNKGIGFTRNRIIEEAKGDYLGFISADDYLGLDFIKVMLQKSGDKDAFYFSDYYVLYEDRRVVEFKCPIFPDYEDFVLACISSLRENKMFVCYNIWGSLKLWKENKFWGDKRIGEDAAHLLECLLAKKIKFVHIPIPLYFYRVHQQMKTSQILDEIPANNRDTFDRINKMLGKEVL